MTNPKVSIINVKELKALIDSDPKLCLIDVRETEEWQEGRIPGAIHIPKDSITTLIKSKVTDITQPIYLHCRSGMRSLFAAQCLLDMGYQQVYSVDGGIVDWASCGYPIETQVEKEA